MRSADVELPPRLRDHAPHDAALGQIERMVRLQARVAPIASGIVRTRHGIDRREAGAGAPLVGRQLPVEKLEQTFRWNRDHPARRLRRMNRLGDDGGKRLDLLRVELY